jgi:hypothetical protein
MGAALMYGLKLLIWVVFFIAFLGLQPVERSCYGFVNLPSSVQSYIGNRVIYFDKKN